MKVDEKAIKKIEEVFGFKLYTTQKIYIMTGKDEFLLGERKQGSTFAYCVRLALSDGDKLPFRTMQDVRALQDEDHGPHYAGFFRSEFLRIWNELRLNGFEVRDLDIRSRR